MAMATATALAIAGMAGGVGRAALESRGNNRAMQAQERARKEALAYQREREANEMKERRQAWQNYENAYRDWYGRYGDEGIKRYGVATGINLNQTPAATPGATPATPAPYTGTTPGEPPATGQPAGGSIMDIMGPTPQPAPAPQPAPPMAMSNPTGAPSQGAPSPVLGSMSPQNRTPSGTISDLGGGGWEDWRRYA